VETGPRSTAATIGFHTFGCKLNQHETEALASGLRARGCAVVDAAEDADAYVLNTCTVTARADHKARAFIRALSRAHAGSLLVVTGCSAELDAEVLSSLAPNVVVVPQSRKAALLDLGAVIGAADDAATRARALGDAVRGHDPDPFALQAEDPSFRTRATLKIQDGCNGRCAFCRVPLARGSAVSLATDQVLRRALDMESRGHREAVLTGVDISSWNADGNELAGLLRLLLEAAPRLRFRLSSLEPECLTEELAAVLSHPRICPHFHLPVQSGADSVLLRMWRRYRSGAVRRGVALLRAAARDPFVAADIIVGFPGETAAEFAATRSLVEELAFAAVHVFPFSPRPGTTAAGMRPCVPERVRTARAEDLSVLASAFSDCYARRWVGRDTEVLFERVGRTGVKGTSANYLHVETLGVPRGDDALGRLGSVLITGTGTRSAGGFRARPAAADAGPRAGLPCTGQFQGYCEAGNAGARPATSRPG
jgi:threonylcarbamoyladenosine tRNA methylthiotransferase MtaB